MAELLVRVVDKINPDFYLNCQCSKAKDVIVVMPDGWTWGTVELTSPEWQLLKFPGLDPAALTGFTAVEIATAANPLSKTLQFRGFYLDLVALAAAAPTAVLNTTQAAAHHPPQTIALTLPQLLALQVQKAPVPDPGIIGTPSSVIG